MNDETDECDECPICGTPILAVEIRGPTEAVTLRQPVLTPALREL